MTEAPAALQDAQQLLTEQGFATGDTWYHGTSSALIDSIRQHGLKRSGDKAMKQAAKSTMATIGNNYTETIEPVFLTQSKQLAHYWACHTIRNRGVRFEGDEQPVVIAIQLPETLNQQVKPDVGAASLLLVEGDQYLPFLAKVYEDCGLSAPDIDLMKADRMDYLNKLGMAYYDKDIEPQYLEVL